MDSFESQDVIDLVESALAEGGSDSLLPERVIPMGMSQGNLLERLYKRLDDHLDNATLQMVYDDLRSELYEGIALPSLKELHTTTLNCRRCADAVKPDPNLPRWNLVDPDCVFIVDNPFYSDETVSYFLESLVEASFSSTRVCLTFVNRCPAVGKLEPQHVKNCTPYLHTELQVLKPKLIVPLGLLPTAAILGTDVKMGEVRGKTIWLGPWPLIPSYSPVYALKSGGSISSTFKSDIATAYSFCYGD